ncbi:MAG: hypothetical protein ACLGI6_07645 [Gammaproteobacteria bacterium]
MMMFAAFALAGLQATTAAPACPCTSVAAQSQPARPPDAVLSAQARTIRDFALFAHRRIVADLIRQRGPYLDTLIDYFPACPDRELKLAWLRRVVASTSDTREFAERIAQQADSGNCAHP